MKLGLSRIYLKHVISVLQFVLNQEFLHHTANDDQNLGFVKFSSPFRVFKEFSLSA